jgi:uncharacterized membrane protein
VTLRRAGIALSLAGVAVAGYLTYAHFAHVKPICGPAGGCARVQASQYAELLGVPVALLGLLSYLVILAALVVDGERARLAAATTALVGFGFSAYLQYRALFTIEATCLWCAISAGLMTGLAVVCVTRLLRPPAATAGAAALVALLLLSGCGGGDDGGGAGIPEEGQTLGDGDAVLAVVTSLGCEPCRRFHTETLPRIIADYVEPGDVRIRTVVLVPGDDELGRQTAAVRAAALQGRFHAALGAAFRTPAPREHRELLTNVRGLDVGRAVADMAAPAVAELAAADRELAGRLGADAAPAFYAGEDEGSLRPIRAPNLSASEVRSALDALTGD